MSMTERDWAERERYGTSYREWVTGNLLDLSAFISFATTVVGGVGSGMDAMSGNPLFVDGRTDWSEIALCGLVATLVLGTLSFRHHLDQERRRSIIGIVFPRDVN